MKAADMATDDGVMGLRTRLSEDRIRVTSWWPRSGGRGRLTEPRSTAEVFAGGSVLPALRVARRRGTAEAEPAIAHRQIHAFRKPNALRCRRPMVVQQGTVSVWAVSEVCPVMGRQAAMPCVSLPWY